MRNIAMLDRGAVPMVLEMAQTGLVVDLDHFHRMERKLDLGMEATTAKVETMTGVHINLDSSPQVSKLLYKTLGLKQPKLKMTKSGERETVDKDMLISMQHLHPVISLLLEYNTLSKLKGTYVEPIPKLARKGGDGNYRVYPNWKMTRVPSGRLACERPNLLAMPNRTKLGREVCEGYVALPGWTLLSVDESQIEPRAVAHRSGDPNLQSIYWNEEDIYSDFAIAAFQLPDERYRDSEWHYPGVDKKLHRFPSKTCILSAIYDVSAGGLLEKMPVMCANCSTPAVEHSPDCEQFEPYWTEVKCERILSDFYARYARILDMRRIDHQRARKFGYIWDDWGRILHITAVHSVLKWVVSAALREVGNFPIQSMAQGTIKLVMAKVHDYFVKWGLYGDVVVPLLQIHDELLFMVREEWAEEIAAYVKSCFETCVELDVPITAGHATSHNWGELVK